MKASDPTSLHVVLQYPALWYRNHHAALRRNLKTSRGVGNVETLLSYSKEVAPCVLLIDSNTAWKYAVEHEHVFALAYADGVNVLVVDDGSTTPETIAELLWFGCRGVLCRQASRAIVRKAVRAVLEGQIWASRHIVSELLQKCLFQLGPNALTHREKEILELIAKGLRNKEIAQTLFISRETVRWHIRSLYSKIGASDRLAAAVYAKEVLLFPKQSSRSNNTNYSVSEGSSAMPPQTLSDRTR